MSTGSQSRAEDNLFRSALDTLSANVAILDADGTIVATNRAWRDFGMTNGIEDSPDMCGLNYLEVTDGVDDRYATRTLAGLSALLDGDREQFTLEYPCHSPTERRWFLLRASSFRHLGERYVTVAHTEITARKLRERTLREAYDISTADKLSFDEQVEALLELARETIGTEYATFATVEDGSYVFEAVTSGGDTEVEAGHTVSLDEVPNCAQVVETQETLVQTNGAKEASESADPLGEAGRYLGAPVIVDGEVHGTVCLYGNEDQTAAFSEWAVTFVELLSNWISYELRRQDREQKLQHIKENISDVVWMTTPEKDEVEFISDSYEDVWGRSLDSVLEEPTAFLEAIHPDDRDRVEEALTAQQSHPDDFEETYRVIRPDGDVRWVHDRSAGVYSDGELHRIIGIATDITDRKRHEQELAYQTALLEALAETRIDGLLVVDTDRSVSYHNDRFLDLWDIPAEAVADGSDETLLDVVRDKLASPEEFRERVESLYENPTERSWESIELADGRWLDQYSAPVIGDDGTHYGRLWVFRDITDRKAREQALTQQRDELARLQRVNRLVRRSIQALQDATTRPEIETAVCEALTESDLYEAAWIGEWTERRSGDRAVDPRTAAGISESSLDGMAGGERSPADIALQTGTVQVVDDVTVAGAVPNAWREAGLADDNHALAAVPLGTDTTTYGVLVVYTPHTHTISETEQDVLADLGQSIALAIQRVHSQHSLTAETVTALDLRIPDTTIVFGTVAAELDATLSLDQRVAAGDGVTLYYLHVEGATPAEVSERLMDDTLIAACTVVRTGDSARPPLLEVRLTEEAQLPLDVLTDYGAVVTGFRAADGDLTLSVELPSHVDIRSVLGALRTVTPEIELVSRHHIDRPTTSAAAVHDRVTDQLTEKQAAALKAAYARGYYTWPRECTMEELAEAFAISSSTLHYRLRKAHDTVIGTVLNPQEVPEDS